MSVLADTDVVLDLVLEREPFVEDAAALFQLHAEGRVDVFISGITLVNVFYVARKARGADAARRAVEQLLASVGVCPVSRPVLETAIRLAFADFEDAVQHESAVASRLDAIVTRNLEDYRDATLPVFAPADFLVHLKAQQP